jgi:hypothetical protein
MKTGRVMVTTARPAATLSSLTGDDLVRQS